MLPPCNRGLGTCKCTLSSDRFSLQSQAKPYVDPSLPMHRLYSISCSARYNRINIGYSSLLMMETKNVTRHRSYLPGASPQPSPALCFFPIHRFLDQLKLLLSHKHAVHPVLVPFPCLDRQCVTLITFLVVRVRKWQGKEHDTENASEAACEEVAH